MLQTSFVLLNTDPCSGTSKTGTGIASTQKTRCPGENSVIENDKWEPAVSDQHRLERVYLHGRINTTTYRLVIIV